MPQREDKWKTMANRRLRDQIANLRKELLLEARAQQNASKIGLTIH